LNKSALVKFEGSFSKRKDFVAKNWNSGFFLSILYGCSRHNRSASLYYVFCPTSNLPTAKLPIAKLPIAKLPNAKMLNAKMLNAKMPNAKIPNENTKMPNAKCQNAKCQITDHHCDDNMLVQQVISSIL
jgi:hypothetical protein